MTHPLMFINQVLAYIANYVIWEKIEGYSNEDIVPPKLGDAWLPKIVITIDKETHHAI
jgi:hypothetical protein